MRYVLCPLTWADIPGNDFSDNPKFESLNHKTPDIFIDHNGHFLLNVTCLSQCFWSIFLSFLHVIFRPYTSIQNTKYLVSKKKVENIIFSVCVRAENDMQKTQKN